jgi:hypothetical protein
MIVRIWSKPLLIIGLTTKIRPSKLRYKNVDPALDLDGIDLDERSRYKKCNN